MKLLAAAAVIAAVLWLAKRELEYPEVKPLPNVDWTGWHDEPQPPQSDPRIIGTLL